MALVGTLNRPKPTNAFNDQMQRELRGLWHGLRYNDDVRCIVLTGAGDKAFALVSTAKTMEQGVAYTTGDRLTGGCRARGCSTIRAQTSSPKLPFVEAGDRRSQRHGVWRCLLHCSARPNSHRGRARDVLRSARHLRHACGIRADPHAVEGAVPEIMRMDVDGNSERFSAQTAYETHGVSTVFPQDKLRETAAWVAQRIADAPPVAVVGSMRARWAALEMGRQAGAVDSDILTRLGNEPSGARSGPDEVRSCSREQWRLR